MKVQLADVTHVYRPARGAEVAALQRVSLGVREGEFLALVGPSGCGKSTLLRLMAGLEQPTAGEIRLNGGHDIGLMFQQPVLLPWRTVLENVLLPFDLMGRDHRRFIESAIEVLKAVGLEGFEHRRPRELSGGMQQRVALCRTLICRPSLLMMDEPFSALDALTRDELAMLTLHLWEGTGQTVVMVTHSVTEAVLLADRVAVMTPRPFIYRSG